MRTHYVTVGLTSLLLTGAVVTKRLFFKTPRSAHGAKKKSLATKIVPFLSESLLGISLVCMIALSCLMPGKAFADLTTGLLAYYPFNGNANDASGHGHNGTVHGATLTVDRFGHPNSAYHFNGIDNFISAVATNLPTATRTVSLWFRAETVSTQPVFLGYGGGVCGTSFFIGLNGGQRNDYYVTSHCNVNDLIYEYLTAPVNAWYHLAISTDSSGTKMYINGVRVASNTNFIANTIVAGKDLALGVAVSPSGFAPYTDRNVGYFKGVLDDIRIYNRALSASEVQQLFQEISGLVCDIQLNKASFVNGEAVIAQVMHITNITAIPQATEFKFWLAVPGSTPPSSIGRGGAYGGFVLPANSSLNFGPRTLFTVSPQTPRGSYAFNCRLLEPVTGGVQTQDLNPFVIR